MNLINFRDLGGTPAANGRKIKSNRLLRSAEPVKMNKEAVFMLTQHGLKALVDFRCGREISKGPDDKIPGVSYVNYDIMADDDEDTTIDEWLFGMNPTRAEKYMNRIYREFITSGSGRNGYSQFIKYCSGDISGAILFHCAAGKDRTGFGAALLLKLLGVANEEIFSDYLQTNESRREHNEKLLAEYRANGMNEEQLVAATILNGVKREYLEAAFATIQEEYGSFENYIEKGLSATPADIARLKDLYLE